MVVPNDGRKWPAGEARRPEKIGAVCWKPQHGQDEDAVVILSWHDWVALHGAVAPRGDLAA
jgi:hypothetical protein